MVQKASLAESWDGGGGGGRRVWRQKSVHLSLSFLLFKKRLIYFIFWLWWVFATAHGLSLVVASRGYSLLRCTGFSLRGPLSRSSGSAGLAQQLCTGWAAPSHVGSSQSRDPTGTPALQGGFLTTGPPVLEAPISFCFTISWSLHTFSDPSVYLNVDMYSLYIA